MEVGGMRVGGRAGHNFKVSKAGGMQRSRYFKNVADLIFAVLCAKRASGPDVFLGCVNGAVDWWDMASVFFSFLCERWRLS